MLRCKAGRGLGRKGPFCGLSMAVLMGERWLQGSRNLSGPEQVFLGTLQQPPFASAVQCAFVPSCFWSLLSPLCSPMCPHHLPSQRCSSRGHGAAQEQRSAMGALLLSPAVCNPCTAARWLIVFLLLLKPSSATAEHSACCCCVLAGHAFRSTAICFVHCKQGMVGAHCAGFAQPRRCEWCCWGIAAFCSSCPRRGH